MCVRGGEEGDRFSMALKVCAVVCSFGWCHSGFGGNLCSVYGQEYTDILWVIFAGEC